MTVVLLEVVSLEEWQQGQLVTEEAVCDLEDRGHDWPEDDQ